MSSLILIIIVINMKQVYFRKNSRFIYVCARALIFLYQVYFENVRVYLILIILNLKQVYPKKISGLCVCVCALELIIPVSYLFETFEVYFILYYDKQVYSKEVAAVFMCGIFGNIYSWLWQCPKLRKESRHTGHFMKLRKIILMPTD